MYAKGVENSETKKNEKGKGKETESRRKRKRVEEDKEDDEYEEVKTQESWRAFVMAQMMKMDAMLNGLSGLVKENKEELKKEIREMWRKNMEDRREYFWKVGKVRKDIRVMEWWVRQIVEWVEDKKLEEESEDELERTGGDGGVRGKE